jgi:2-polyprenyl-6-hydroxyphenyl methylase/3-demethylubiquinone-9 3-methyltransferase
MDHRDDIKGYGYHDTELGHAHGYLLPALSAIVDALEIRSANRRIFDLGCGNGSVAQWLTQRGFDVTGVDPSTEGIGHAKRCRPNLKLHEGSAYDDLAAIYGRFPVVVSLEVVEHVYSPRRYAATLYSLVEPGGAAIVSTPYHGYFKNLAMALTNKMDAHFTALWENGHIKFWSFKTLRLLLEEAGFRDIEFRRVGRVPALAKAMIAVARKPDYGDKQQSGRK